MRLRVPGPGAPINVVLVNPEIPQNTGNIARLCAATGSVLHLVGKLGFSTDEKAVRRAGLDYWHLVTVREHDDLESCLDSIGRPSVFVLSTGASTSYLEAEFTPGCALVFGAESVGLPAEIRKRYREESYGIPTRSESVRSLNLANATAIVLYRALETTGALEGASLE